MNLGTGGGSRGAMLISGWAAQAMACLAPPTSPGSLLHCFVCTVGGRTLTTEPSVVETIAEPAPGLWGPPEHCCPVWKKKGQSHEYGAACSGSPLCPFLRGQVGQGARGVPHLGRYSHDLLQAPAVGERLCQRHSPGWANAVP